MWVCGGGGGGGGGVVYRGPYSFHLQSDWDTSGVRYMHTSCLMQFRVSLNTSIVPVYHWGDGCCDTSVHNLTKALDGEKKCVKEFERHVPQVEERLRNVCMCVCVCVSMCVCLCPCVCVCV